MNTSQFFMLFWYENSYFLWFKPKKKGSTVFESQSGKLLEREKKALNYRKNSGNKVAGGHNLCNALQQGTLKKEDKNATTSEINLNSPLYAGRWRVARNLKEQSCHECTK